MSRALSLGELYALAYAPRAVEPYPYQRALAEDDSYDVLIAPTGLGKTAAVTLAWAWRRLTQPSDTPRRLVWCLPMRSLVEQVEKEVNVWMDRLADQFAVVNQCRPEVSTIMGGAVDTNWRLFPERSAILIGTQDMLLSRALMRGYGMSRFAWPVDFGFLHTDALWVFDEVQLMGSGLATSAQLEGFRRARSKSEENLSLARSLWISATLRPEWLNTVDLVKIAPKLRVLRWDAAETREPGVLTRRLDAKKIVVRAATRLLPEHVKKPELYAEALAAEVLDIHRRGYTTLVVLNRVHRAQAVYRALLRLGRNEESVILIHSRFRAPERRRAQQALGNAAAKDKIVIATQALECGIDITSTVLFTELAPWSSLVQRFGRCNRAGELNETGGAEIRWIDIETDGAADLTLPYIADELAEARSKVEALRDAAPRQLPAADRGPTAAHILRRKDFDELFDTDPDLSGYDLDISPFVRDAEDTDVRLFWRERLDADPNAVEPPRRIKDVAPPERDELCSASIEQVRRWLSINMRGKRPIAAYIEDPNARENGWLRLDPRVRLRPGLVILLDHKIGGYDPRLGLNLFDATGPVPPLQTAISAQPDETSLGNQTDTDPLSSERTRDILLETHLLDVAGEASRIIEAAGLPGIFGSAVIRAAAWHDLGKAHQAFQARIGNNDGGRGLLAKSTSRYDRRVGRPYFRHELASALAFLQQHDREPQADLVAFLIAAHHGKVRMGLRALSEERKPSDPAIRFARGVWDGDWLPAIACGSEISTAIELSLAPMEMGEDPEGRPSWAARMQALLQEHGPFRLAYLEALVRIADWRASEAEQREEVLDAV